MMRLRRSCWAICSTTARSASSCPTWCCSRCCAASGREHELRTARQLMQGLAVESGRSTPNWPWPPPNTIAGCAAAATRCAAPSTRWWRRSASSVTTRCCTTIATSMPSSCIAACVRGGMEGDTRMFSKILIANRGEIACRVIKTARRMGIATVAVYSEADANARHVRLADEAVLHRPGRRRASPTCGATRSSTPPGRPARRRSIRATASCPRTTDFAEACARGRHRLHRPAGLGDPRHGLQVRRQGADGQGRRAADARLSRRRPGRRLSCERRRATSAIPVLIKASRRRRRQGHAPRRQARRTSPPRWPRASARRRNAFGDEHVLIEKYVLRPRHIEIQVFGDTHGNCVHLFERDCSVQRRHQKVLEEAPAPGMTRRAPRRDGRGRGRGGQGGRLCRRRHGRVHRRHQDGTLLLHGDEHAAAGRASGDRDDHRARPGRVAVARRRRRAAAAAQEQLAIAAMRSRRASTPRIRTRASCRRPARLLHLVAAGRERACARRHRRRAGRRDHAALRPDDRQADRLGPRPRARALARMRQALARVPRRRRRQQRRVPVAAGRLPGLRRRRSRHRPDRARAGEFLFPAQAPAVPDEAGCSPRWPSCCASAATARQAPRRRPHSPWRRATAGG